MTVESNRLREKWLIFLSNCPAQDRLNLDHSEPTVEGLVELVKKVALLSQAKKDNTRRGKAMKAFHKFCGTVDSHKAMLELIPSGNEYVSILTGSLNVVIQVLESLSIIRVFRAELKVRLVSTTNVLPKGFQRRFAPSVSTLWSVGQNLRYSGHRP